MSVNPLVPGELFMIIKRDSKVKFVGETAGIGACIRGPISVLLTDENVVPPTENKYPRKRGCALRWHRRLTSRRFSAGTWKGEKGRSETFQDSGYSDAEAEASVDLAMFGHGLETIAHLQFVANIFYVSTHRLHADPEIVSDLLINKTGRKQGQNLLFPGRKIILFGPHGAQQVKMLHDFARNMAGHGGAAGADIAHRVWAVESDDLI